MNYRICTGKEDRPQTIIIVGAGGTGGFVAEALCRLTIGREDTIILVDHDIVEPHNLLRQNFHRADIGHFKSRCLAERLANTYDRPVGYSAEPFSPEWLRGLQLGRHFRHGVPADIIVGCVDNAAARAAIAKAASHSHHFGHPCVIDTGNGKNWGQILIGDTSDTELLRNSFEGNHCHGLPLPTIQRPDLLTYVPDDPPDIDCAAAMSLTDQDPTINQVVAALTVQVIRRMLADNCPFLSLYLDMDLGITTPTYATPENVSRITGLPVADLIKPEKAQPEPDPDGTEMSDEDDDYDESQDYW